MRVTRRHLVAGASAAAIVPAIARFPAGAAEYTYRIGAEFPETHPCIVDTLRAAA